MGKEITAAVVAWALFTWIIFFVQEVSCHGLMGSRRRVCFVALGRTSALTGICFPGGRAGFLCGENRTVSVPGE
jgi:hypothetical protein